MLTFANKISLFQKSFFNTKFSHQVQENEGLYGDILHFFSGDYFVTALELAIIVLDVVHDIANGDDYNCDQESENIGYATHFFNAFNREVVKQRNHDFMYMLADQVDDMIEDADQVDDMIKDKNLNAKHLRKLYKEYLDYTK